MSVTLAPRGAHQREGFVAGRVEEDDLARADVDVVRADVLGDAARLAGRHRRLADRVEQRGLAVVDVAHHGDHGRARDHVLGLLSTFCSWTTTSSNDWMVAS
jgi:hypothetical protein